MGCGCRKNKAIVSTTTAQAEAAQSVPKYRYKVTTASGEETPYLSYVEAKRAQRASGGKIASL